MIANMVLKWFKKFKDEESPEPIGYVLQINFQKDDNIKSINYAVVNKPEALCVHVYPICKSQKPESGKYRYCIWKRRFQGSYSD